MRQREPLLRAPPFPGVARNVAAVSVQRPGDEVDDTGVLAAITEARVGGAFWAPPARDPRPIVLRPRDPSDLAALIARGRALGATPSDMLALPLGPFPSTLDRTAAAAGVELGRSAMDPWSVLGPSTVLLSAQEDEWRLIARLAGVRDGDVASEEEVARTLAAATYRDCFAGTATTISRAIEILASWRATLDRVRPVSVAMGMAWWKRDAIRRLLWSGRRSPLRFVEDPQTALVAARTAGGAVATWPSRVPALLEEAATRAQVPVMRVEDGFVRSVGLGSNLHPPLSIVLDARGIYYDPTQPSDLEHLLQHAPFPAALAARGEALAHMLVARGISKYAVGSANLQPLRRTTRRLVLITGQVEDDLSVRRAGGEVAGNLDLLRRARAAEPHSHLLFKPHPDVDAGHRVGRIDDAKALDYADEVVRQPIDALLGEVDAVHVLTSLTGFEALLRGREVFVHGQPFYAGWGLTTDLAPPLPRRTRRLRLGELVAGALILYPLYLDPVTQLPCPPEILLDRLARGEVPRPSLLVRARALQGRVFKRFGKVTS